MIQISQALITQGYGTLIQDLIWHPFCQVIQAGEKEGEEEEVLEYFNLQIGTTFSRVGIRSKEG